MQVVEARVKFPVGKAFQSRYGKPRVNVVFTLDSGDEAKVYGSPDDGALKGLSRGDRVQLIRDGKGNYKLAENGQSSTPPQLSAAPAPTSSASWSPDQKRVIRDRVDQRADLLAHCLKVARKKFVDAGLVQTEESVRSLATTLFIESLRG
ncbi:MAG: hypothetical protein AAFY15_01640 [Cyanobacteria bacterium J06648_11]